MERRRRRAQGERQPQEIPEPMRQEPVGAQAAGDAAPAHRRRRQAMMPPAEAEASAWEPPRAERTRPGRPEAESADLAQLGPTRRRLAALEAEAQEERASKAERQRRTPPTDATLEPIRPEEYRGRQAQRMRGRKKKAQAVLTGVRTWTGPRVKAAAKQGGRWASRAGRRLAHMLAKPQGRRRLTVAALAFVAVVSAGMAGSILMRSVQTKRLEAELSKRHAQLVAEEPTPTAPPFVVFTGAVQDEATPSPEDGQNPDGMTPGEAAQTAGSQEASQEEASQEETPQETAVPQNLVSTTTFHRRSGEALEAMATLREDNHDLVGWLNIPEVLDLPVVYRNNYYYLTHDFYGRQSASGTIFLDESHPFRESTQNLLLHGHNMKDGTMFGRLIQYERDISYLKNHPFITLSTLWEEEAYVIFAVLRVSLDVKSEDFFNFYSHPTFSSDAEFDSYVRQLELRSIYAIPMDVKASDALLTLSTCLDEDRLVIVARRMREDETRTQMRAVVRLATAQ